MTLMILLTIILLVLSIVVVHGHSKSDHLHSRNPRNEIRSLPNLSRSLSFRHYAGYLSLNETKEDMFYWYAEASDVDPEEAPLVLWLNGGPGCSSLGGFFVENGPFVVQYDLSIHLNPYRWNKRVNMVWLESPSGVGFSSPEMHQDKEGDYYSDATTTARTVQFLAQFFEMYSELQHRAFYITGESYSGMYVPNLVSALTTRPENIMPGIKSIINLQGFAIGNPFTDAKIDGNAYFDYFYTHAMISVENYGAVKQFCGEEVYECMYTSKNCSQSCSQAIQEGVLEADTDQLNPYYIYGDKCFLKNSQAGLLRYTKKKDLPLSPEIRQSRGEVGPCADQFTNAYLNLKSVQAVLGVAHKNIQWEGCNHDIGEVYARTVSALPWYRKIFAAQDKPLKALIYSGDADSVVNFIGTQRWITSEGLNLTVTEKWKPWFGPDNQLAGYVQQYQGLKFKTIKGAGHMVPSVRPLHALYMFECFIFGDEVCQTFHYPFNEEQEHLRTGYSKPNASDLTSTMMTHHYNFGSRASFPSMLVIMFCVGGITGIGLLMQTHSRRYRYEVMH